jgi:phospholipid-binding lipoprotein MlaA
MIAVALAALSMPAAAAHAASVGSEVDPLEKANRVGFAIHEFFDRHVIRPAALTYQTIVPGPLRDGVRHMLDNLGEPRTAANDVLQFRFEKAATAVVRFAANSTVGVLGFFDVATHMGLPRHENGFDLTLGRAGIKAGPYLFVPFLGPATFRDAIGYGVNVLLDPMNGPVVRAAPYLVVTKGVVGGLDLRARADSELTAVLGDATDPYATMRSLYLQNQQSKIDDTSTAVPPLPDFDEDSPPTPATPKSDSKAPGPAASADTTSPVGSEAVVVWRLVQASDLAKGAPAPAIDHFGA